MLIPSSSVNTTPELRIFTLTGFLRFFRRFPQINVGGDSAHLSSFGKRTRVPRLRSPAKGHVATITYISFWFWVKTKVNLIDYYVILINYLRVFLCVIHYISSSSPHQPPLLLHILPPHFSTNQKASTFLYKPTQTYPQIKPTPPLKPLVTTLF